MINNLSRKQEPFCTIFENTVIIGLNFLILLRLFSPHILKDLSTYAG